MRKVFGGRAFRGEEFFVTSGYNFAMFTTKKINDIKRIEIPVSPDSLEFIEWKEDILKMSCYKLLEWDEVELFFDCKSMQWIDKA